MAIPASAGPTDPITMPDDNLRACINAELGQGATDPITEAQATTVKTVDCQSAGVTELTGIEYLTTVETVWLNNNTGIVDLAPLANLTTLQSLGLNFTGIDDADLASLNQLTDLWSLGLWGNSLSDLSELAGLTNLVSLRLTDNAISDLSDLAGLTNLEYLYLSLNEITDLSDFTGLTNLRTLDVEDQSVSLPSAPMNSPTTNPVADVAGDPVPVTSTDSGFSYDSATEAWTFTTLGNKSLTWSTPVTIGTVSNAEFSGTISQRISSAHAVPENPTVTQAVCMNGDAVYPQITLPDTEGITYSIVGDVAPGETVTIEAVPADEDHAIYVDPATDWVGDSDHIYATLAITLNDPDCDTPAPTVIDAPNGDLPINDPCGPDNATWVLPTGVDVPVGFTWKVSADGLLTAEANDSYVFSDPSDNLEPTLRGYGYAPDTNEACPASSDSDGDDSDQVETTGHTLPNAGGPGATPGIVAVALLGIGGLMVLTGRARRQRA